VHRFAVGAVEADRSRSRRRSGVRRRADGEECKDREEDKQAARHAHENSWSMSGKAAVGFLRIHQNANKLSTSRRKYLLYQHTTRFPADIRPVNPRKVK
jgi:hypothetical protein